MKLIHGQYVMPRGTSISIERLEVGAAPRVSISINMGERHIYPCALMRRATFYQLLDLLRAPIESIWGGPFLSVYNSPPHQEDVRKFIHTVEEYCK